MENIRGILLMILSMGGFAVEDMFIKWAAADLPVGQILMMLGLAGTPVFIFLGHRQKARFLSRSFFDPAVLGRNCAEVVGTMGFVTALTLMPLAAVTTILQATPLVVTFGAALFLGETVGWRRWSAIVVGFAGVVLVVRPGMQGFDSASLWAVVGVIGLSVRDLATRRVPPSILTPQLAAWAFASVALLGATMLATSGGAVLPSALQFGLILGALVFGIMAYWAIVETMRHGDVSVIAPFRYSRLIYALIIGWLVFHEIPDNWTLVGAALIIASGIYTVIRERRRKMMQASG